MPSSLSLRISGLKSSSNEQTWTPPSARPSRDEAPICEPGICWRILVADYIQDCPTGPIEREDSGPNSPRWPKAQPGQTAPPPPCTHDFSGGAKNARIQRNAYTD